MINKIREGKSKTPCSLIGKADLACRFSGTGNKNYRRPAITRFIASGIAVGFIPA